MIYLISFKFIYYSYTERLIVSRSVKASSTKIDGDTHLNA